MITLSKGLPLSLYLLAVRRALLLENVKDENDKEEIMVQPGSLYALGYKTNRRYKHSIPKMGKKKTGPRISIVFRSLKKSVPMQD